MAGLAPISLQQFINPTTGLPYSGARAAFYEASTLTPITVYQDYGLDTAHSNPVRADSQGRFPAIFIDEEVEFYRLRLTTSSGAVLPLGENGEYDISILPVIGPGGSGGSVTIEGGDLDTGDIIFSPKTGARTNFVRLNGRTIGSAGSGASERANADTEDLYSFYWSTFSDTLAPVTGGRGISAAADFAANKPLQLLNGRNAAMFGLSDMGNSSSGAFTSLTFTVGDETTAGSILGAATRTLVEANLPAITPAGTVALSNATLVHRAGTDVNVPTSPPTVPAISTSLASAVTIAATFTGTPFGSGTAFDNMPKGILGTFYQRL